VRWGNCKKLNAAKSYPIFKAPTRHGCRCDTVAKTQEPLHCDIHQAIAAFREQLIHLRTKTWTPLRHKNPHNAMMLLQPSGQRKALSRHGAMANLCMTVATITGARWPYRTGRTSRPHNVPEGPEIGAMAASVNTLGQRMAIPSTLDHVAQMRTSAACSLLEMFRPSTL